LLFLGLAAIIVVLDQITKALATHYLADGRIVKLFSGDLVWFLYVQNSGLAMGMRFLPPYALAAIAVIAVVVLGFYLYRHPLQPLFQGIPLALIMAGAAGNMIDRITIGQVTDFISVDMPDFLMDRFWVFNIADSAVSVGVVILLLASILHPADRDRGAFAEEE
jgi:signal peptidase II